MACALRCVPFVMSSNSQQVLSLMYSDFFFVALSSRSVKTEKNVTPAQEVIVLSEEEDDISEVEAVQTYMMHWI